MTAETERVNRASPTENPALPDVGEHTSQDAEGHEPTQSVAQELEERESVTEDTLTSDEQGV